MFKHKPQIIVGITTYYNEFLGLSIPGLSRLGRRFSVVIYNDNPDTRIIRRQIRRMGYRGALHIINGTHNIGQLRARLAILDFVRAHRPRAQWFMFADDDDIIANLTVPNVSDKNFAVIQNMVVIRSRLSDVLRVVRDANNYTVDNENVYLVRPHVGCSGTMVRLSVMLRMGDVLNKSLPAIIEVDESLSYRPPVDMMMWSALNIVARHDNELATPIYMDNVNYIATDIDTALTKYGMKIQPSKNASLHISRAIARYDAAVRATLATECAAPMGYESDA